MSHFGDFMEGVPVKISEKYIRPPKIELPYSVIESSQRGQNAVENVNYYFKFEENVISKLREVRSAKEKKKIERRHRLQLLIEAKQKKLDAIAAVEAEEKLKQLSVSEVSYPSTEEISEISPDDNTDKNCDTTLREEETQTLEPEVTPQNDYSFPTCSTQPEQPLNILQPIQVQSNYPQNNLLDDPDPLQNFKMSTKAVQIPQYHPAYAKHHIDNLTFKDFENDTSSPFDNVELKTINDMELLAQVLQSQKEAGNSCEPQPQYASDQQPYSAMANCASQTQVEAMTYLPNAYVEQPIQGHAMMYTSPQHYPVHNGYYVPLDNSENVNMYMPNYQYYMPPNPYPVNTQYFNQVPKSNEVNQIIPESMYIPQPYYFNYPQRQPVYEPPAYVPNLAPEIKPNSSASSTQNSVKSRSRSIPDIFKELNDELAMAKLRASERSHNASPSPKEVNQPSSSNEKKERNSKKKPEQLPNPYDKLSDKLQTMCQKIHGMGFPLDRVARVCTLVGDSDKKVIEGLLIMDELMDLGFPEGRVSTVLAKHDFNREKALNALVS